MRQRKGEFSLHDLINLLPYHHHRHTLIIKSSSFLLKRKSHLPYLTSSPRLHPPSPTPSFTLSPLSLVALCKLEFSSSFLSCFSYFCPFQTPILDPLLPLFWFLSLLRLLCFSSVTPLSLDRPNILHSKSAPCSVTVTEITCHPFFPLIYSFDNPPLHPRLSHIIWKKKNNAMHLWESFYLWIYCFVFYLASHMSITN